uniref:Dynein light chain roadblock n=1 Tax=Culicoides sonorensis TaxID=179676 RepID=A0A336LE92_CULSO
MAVRIEERLKKLLTFPGVKAFLVINYEGVPIKTSFADDDPIAIHYAALMTRLTDKLRKVVKDLDATNEFKWIRIRTKKDEIVVAPEKDFILVVVQEPTD